MQGPGSQGRFLSASCLSFCDNHLSKRGKLEVRQLVSHLYTEVTVLEKLRLTSTKRRWEVFLCINNACLCFLISLSNQGEAHASSKHTAWLWWRNIRSLSQPWLKISKECMFCVPALRPGEIEAQIDQVFCPISHSWHSQLTLTANKLPWNIGA